MNYIDNYEHKQAKLEKARNRGWLLLPLFLSLTIFYITYACKVHNTYVQNYESYWTMADRSSTLEAKAQYIDKFVTTLEENQNTQFAPMNAWLFPNPTKSFALNLQALKTLAARLHEIQTMDPASFQYNTAISQITAQEQGEAQSLLDNFYGSYLLKTHLLLWNGVPLLIAIVLACGLILGLCFLCYGYKIFSLY
jgi:hypothetical protein